MSERSKRIQATRSVIEKPEVTAIEALIYVVQHIRYEFWLSMKTYAPKRAKKLGDWLVQNYKVYNFRHEMTKTP